MRFDACLGVVCQRTYNELVKEDGSATLVAALAMALLMLFINLAALGILLKLVKVVFFSKSTRRLPPGPKPLPLIGNLFDMPKNDAEKVFAQWSEVYGTSLEYCASVQAADPTDLTGDVTYLNLLGQEFYCLGHISDAMEVFEKHGAKTSDRPTFAMCGELLGWDQSLVLTPYGERWRSSRKLLHQYIGGRGQLETTLAKFGELEEAETHASLKRILKDPAHLEEHIRK